MESNKKTNNNANQTPSTGQNHYGCMGSIFGNMRAEHRQETWLNYSDDYYKLWSWGYPDEFDDFDD